MVFRYALFDQETLDPGYTPLGECMVIGLASALIGMAVQDQMSLWPEGEVPLEVIGHRQQSSLLACQQTALRVLGRRLSGWEEDTVQGEPGFQLLLFNRH